MSLLWLFPPKTFYNKKKILDVITDWKQFQIKKMILFIKKALSIDGFGTF